MNRQRKKKKISGIPQVIEVDRQKHALMILRRFQEMQRENEACDFTIKVDGRSIHVHREILCGGSQYFKGLLMKESRRSEVDMLGVDYDCAKLCIDFIYGRDVNVNPEQYENLLFVAHLMQLKMLCKAVEESMMEHVSTKTLLQYKNAANFYGCHKLKIKCERFSRIYFEEVTRADDFKEIDKESLLLLLKSKRSRMEEDDKLSALLRWVKHEAARSPSLMDLLEGIDLMKIPQERLGQFVEMEEIIQENKACLKKFKTAIVEHVERTPDDPNLGMKNFLIFPRNSEYLQYFNPRTNRLNEMTVKKSKITVDYSVTVFEDAVYIFADDKSVHRFRYWDEVAEWEKLTDMKEKHGMYPPTAISSRKIYVIGAFGQGYSTDAAERYHPDYRDWETLPNKPTRSDGAQLVSVNDSIYCIGGWVDGEATKDLFELETNFFEWASLSPMNETRAGHSVAQWRGNIIVAGGSNQWHKHKSVECYNIDTGQWSNLPDMNVERATFNLLPSDGFLFAVGGAGRKQAANVIEKYVDDENVWKLVKLTKETAPKVYQSVAVEVDDI